MSLNHEDRQEVIAMIEDYAAGACTIHWVRTSERRPTYFGSLLFRASTGYFEISTWDSILEYSRDNLPTHWAYIPEPKS